MSSENTRGGSYQGHFKAGRPDSNMPSNTPPAGSSDLKPAQDAREQAVAAKQPTDTHANEAARATRSSSKPEATAALLRERMPHGIGYNICDDD